MNRREWMRSEIATWRSEGVIGGDVALDIFPGFTYDRRTDGYVKTSFLWRLFRNGYDPKNGRKADVLFLPVWG